MTLRSTVLVSGLGRCHGLRWVMSIRP